MRERHSNARSESEPVDVVITNSPGDFLDVAETLPLLYMSGSPIWSWLRNFPSAGS